MKIGKKWYSRPRKILTMEETARVIMHLEDPILLAVETCIATGARISEVLGLQWKYVDLDAGTIRIEQRVWHRELGPPKSETSKRMLAVGNLVERFKDRAAIQKATPDAWVFRQKRDPSQPLWDSAVRDALHQAAKAENCDFAGLGPHSFRRANITWRQQVGGTAIEASKIAGHSDVDMTAEYTFVDIERQQQLTCAIQEKLAKAKEEKRVATVPNLVTDMPPTSPAPQNQSPPFERMRVLSRLVH